MEGDWDVVGRKGRGVMGRGEWGGENYGVRITIHALERAAILLVLSDEVEGTVYFYDPAAVRLHVLVCSCCGYCCAWDL